MARASTSSGRNGDGKSSLLELLTDQLQPDSVRMTWCSGLWVNVLREVNTHDQQRIIGWTLVGDQAQHQWASNAHIRNLVSRMNSNIAWKATSFTLSGRQYRRVKLAKLLVGD